jgi:hypothetical protein
MGLGEQRWITHYTSLMNLYDSITKLKKREVPMSTILNIAIAIAAIAATIAVSIEAGPVTAGWLLLMTIGIVLHYEAHDLDNRFLKRIEAMREEEKLYWN